jgi:hypothetical protein
MAKGKAKEDNDSNYSAIQNDINTSVARSTLQIRDVLPNKQLPFCNTFLRLPFIV